MGEHITVVYGKVDYKAVVLLLEAHRDELEEEIGKRNANATIYAISDLADEQTEDETEDD